MTDSAQPLFRLPVTPRWRDLDAFNHVNNSNFLTYLEEARIHWFQSLGEQWVTSQSAPVLAAVHLNYRRPVDYPSELVVELYCERLGNSSVTIGHRIIDAGDGALYSDGHVVAVWMDRASGRAVPLPDAVRRAVAAPAG